MPKIKTPAFLLLLIIFSAQYFSAAGAKKPRLLFLPIDERFTTRDLFLSLAEITRFQVATPRAEILPRKKIIPDNRKILLWTENNSKNSDYAIISAEMLLYGGLIASRTSSESLSEIRRRLKVFETIRRENPRLKIFVSTTVMRMPQYSSAEEEPDYYAEYGRQIFLFSQFSHRHEVLGRDEDLREAEVYKSRIPPAVLADYLARRERNFQINKDLVELVRRDMIDRLVITLDDNAEYGFFKREAAELAQVSAPLKERIAIYPGADEAQLTLLSRLAVGGRSSSAGRVPTFVAYRFPDSRKLIPAFEGQPLEESVRLQLEAAGGRVVDDLKLARCVLYVNNFAGKNTFATGQNLIPERTEPLEKFLEAAGIKSLDGKILIVADNRFYNGADSEIVSAIFAGRLSPLQIAYAGWNTSGNTLGSAISQGFLRARMKLTGRNRLAYKKLLFARFVEDWVYMVAGRAAVREDLRAKKLTDFAGTPLEAEYEKMMKGLFNRHAPSINRFLGARLYIQRVFFPWHRSFEVGFEIAGK